MVKPKVLVTSDPLPENERWNYIFLTKASAFTRIRDMTKGYHQSELDGAYKSFELRGLLNLRSKFRKGDVRRIHIENIDDNSPLKNIPLVRYHDLRIIECKKAYTKLELYYPTLEMIAITNGYYSRKEFERRVNAKHPQILSHNIHSDIDPNSEYDELGILDNSDEEERMLLDSGEEYEKAKNSTSDIRGEHPFSRFLVSQ